MSTSPTTGATQGKLNNLSVTSLLSSATAGQTKDASSISKNLPTVANTELLYKTISSRSVSPSQMPPLAPTRPQMVMTRPHAGMVRSVPSSVNYSVNQVYEKHGYSSYANNPISHIKTLNNTIAPSQVKTVQNIHQTPSSTITLTQGQKTTLPASSIVYSRLSNSPVSCSTYTTKLSSVTNGEMTIHNISDDSSSYKCEVVSEGDANLQDCSSDSDTYTSSQSIYTSGESRYVDTVALVPKGWNRIMEKGVIIYIR